ncbi:hypothetical protein [Brevundimonas sp.]
MSVPCFGFGAVCGDGDRDGVLMMTVDAAGLTDRPLGFEPARGGV